jgi:Zn-dependent M16 (insulinase) family peptidase
MDFPYLDQLTRSVRALGQESQGASIERSQNFSDRVRELLERIRKEPVLIGKIISKYFLRKNLEI